MFEHLKEDWRAFKESRPGQRFWDYHERVRHQTGPIRWVRIGLGLIATAAGLVMLVAPGPGILFLFFGLALLAARSAWLAKMLDKAELWLRRVLRAAKVWWDARALWQKVALVVVVLAGVAGAAWLAWRWLIG